MKLKEWLDIHGFESWEQAENEGDIHIENSERDMKLWFLEDMSTADILDILEGNKSTNYGCWDYIEDIDKWVFVYQ